MTRFGLKPALLLDRDDFDDCAFGDAPPAVFAKDAEVQQHIALEAITNEETESPRGVEPFHPSGDRLHFGRGRNSSLSMCSPG